MQKKRLLFCTSGKTYGHFFKIHMLYSALKEEYQCFEIVNPTEFSSPFIDELDNHISISSDLYFYNDSFIGQYSKLTENIKTLKKLVASFSADIVISDKLPNLMTACYELGIPYISVTHATQISHNLKNYSNPNLSLFDRYWSENKLIKPVSDTSWFFYRNYGEKIVFADSYNVESAELDSLGYSYSFIGPIPVVLGDPKNSLSYIKNTFSEGKYDSVALFTMSSYASEESDNFLISLAKEYSHILFITPRNSKSVLVNKLLEKKVKNVCVVDMIDYLIAKQIARVFICLPGNATLQSLSDYKYPIVGLYVHEEQKNNAQNFNKENFSYSALGPEGLELSKKTLANITSVNFSVFDSIVVPKQGSGVPTDRFCNALSLSST